MITVEVAYATPERQLILELRVPAGTTAMEAVRLSGITKEFPAIDLKNNPMGIFSSLLDGKDYPLPEKYKLQRKDRVEIYRPLLIDPKQARSARAKKSAQVKKSALAKKSARAKKKVINEKAGGDRN